MLSQRQQINQTELISLLFSLLFQWRIMERFQLCVLQPLLKSRVKT